MVVSCGHDENGRYRNGAAGDQTGTEYYKRDWYKPSYGWDCVLRYPDAKVGTRIAEIAEEAAANENIGYDQNQRLTFYNALKVTWCPKDIKTKVESDCSASTAATVIAAGHQLGLIKLTQVSPSCWTGNLKQALVNAGFECLTAQKYLTSDNYLQAGDILLNEAHHVVINISTKNGSTMSAYTGTVNAKSGLMVRTGPGTNYTVVAGFPSGLPHGAKVGIDKEQNKWGRIAGTSFWVYLGYVSK